MTAERTYTLERGRFTGTVTYVCETCGRRVLPDSTGTTDAERLDHVCA